MKTAHIPFLALLTGAVLLTLIFSDQTPAQREQTDEPSGRTVRIFRVLDITPVYTLTVSTNSGNGTVTKYPDQSMYDYKSAVRLWAIPIAGAHFVKWTGDVRQSESTKNPLTVTMLDNSLITAIFALNSNTIAFALDQNYPNPFNPSTIIAFQLPVRARVRLKVYDVLGKEVAQLVDETEDAGYKTVEWRAGTAPSGVYFYRIEMNTADDRFMAVKEMLLVK